MTNTTYTITSLDMILIYAREAVSQAENAETNARIALTTASKGSDRDMEYAARCALVTAMGAASAARETVRRLVDLNRRSMEEKLKASTTSV